MMRISEKYFPRSAFARARLGFVIPAALLTACQVVQPPVAPPSHLPISPPANQDSGTSTANPTDGTTTSTYTIKRDSLKQTLSMQGRVAPSRSAQLTLHGGGTVTAVNVQVGQAVQQGDALAEFALDDQSLQAARTQATLAELAYESEQTKLDQLQAGAPKDSVDQARATIAHDQAAIAELQQQQAATQDAADRAQKAAAIARDAADRKVQLAQVALQSAKDTLSAAQQTAQQAEDTTRSAHTQAVADAAAALDAATQSVRSGERAVKQATIKLSQAKMNWATTRASQELETLQFKLGEDTDAVKEAKAASAAAQHGTAAQSTQADMQLAAAQRALQADSLQLKHANLNAETARTVDEAAVATATLDLEAAQDQLTQAQAAQQQAERKVQNLDKQQTTSVSSQSSQLTPEAAQATITQAQHAVETATINLQEAQAVDDQAASGLDATGGVPPAPDAHAMDAAQAQLSADQSRLAQLLAATSAAEVSREQTRVNLLHDQATAAAAAAQAVTTLRAPFDGTVTDVGISAGQTVAPGMTADGSITTAPAALAGQSSQGEPVAIRMVASGANSIVADASESDVSQLNPGQTVDVSFPGLSGQIVSASISQIASAPTVKDGRTSYPVQIDLSSAPPKLRMGMTALVNISSGEADQVLVAPRAAVHIVAGQSSVTKIDTSGQWLDVPVQIGRSAGGNVELLGAVQEGDKIVLYTPSSPPFAPALIGEQPAH